MPAVQGSIIGPLLFNILTSDLYRVIQANTLVSCSDDSFFTKYFFYSIKNDNNTSTWNLQGLVEMKERMYIGAKASKRYTWFVSYSN